MTNQEIFDKALAAIRKQGEPSYDSVNSECRYRLETGGKVLKCPVGHFIPKKDYNPKMEGTTLTMSNCAIFKYFSKNYTESNIDLFDAIQNCHDSAALTDCETSKFAGVLLHDGHDFLSRFEKRMKEVAEDYELDYAL